MSDAARDVHMQELEPGWVVSDGRGTLEILHVTSPMGIAVRVDGEVLIRYETIKRALEHASIKEHAGTLHKAPYREAIALNPLDANVKG